VPEPYIGEVRMFAGNFAPAGWAFCNGQLLPIAENDVLFSLIGTTYGGDGQQTFAMPDLRGRGPIHMGNGPDGTVYALGSGSGAEEVTLSVQQIPSHTHALIASQDAGNANTPGGNIPAQTSGGVMLYREVEPSATLNAAVDGISGGSQPHENMQPFLCISFIISLFGIYPQQT
jgi:microcystin-dependent protein